MANFFSCRLSRWLLLPPSSSFQLAHALRKSKQPACFSKQIKCSIHSTPLATANGKVKHALNAFQGSNLPGTTGEVEKAAEKPVKKSRNQKKRDRAKCRGGRGRTRLGFGETGVRLFWRKRARGLHACPI
jgi:hypothetical protein